MTAAVGACTGGGARAPRALAEAAEGARATVAAGTWEAFTAEAGIVGSDSTSTRGGAVWEGFGDGKGCGRDDS